MKQRLCSLLSLPVLLAALPAAGQSNPLPPPNHSVDFGYYFADTSQYGDFYDEVKCYTNLHMPGYGVEDPVERQAFRDSLQRAVNDGKKIYISLGMTPDGPFDPDAERARLTPLLDVLSESNYWPSVAYLELTDEPNWGPTPNFGSPQGDDLEHEGARRIDDRANFVRDLLNVYGLPWRPIGLVLDVNSTFIIPWPTNANRYTYSSLNWVGGQTYLYSTDFTSSCEAIDSLTSRVARFKQRMAPKSLIMAMEAYTQGGAVTNLQALMDIQRTYYSLAANDSRVLALTMFSYARTSGTREHPELVPLHRQMGERFLGGLPSGCAQAAPALANCDAPPPPPGGTYPPQNLRITGAAGNRVFLQWENVGTPGTRFWIYGSPDGVTFSYKGERPAGSTTAEPVVGLPGLPNVGLMRCFYVEALFGDGHPKDSGVVCTTVFRDPPSTAPVPQGPTGCVASLRPHFRWDSIPTATRYSVVVTRMHDGVPVDWDDAIDGTSYEPKTDLQPGIRYGWHVRGCNNQGCGTDSSLWSPWTYVTPFCAPRADLNGDGRSDLLFRSAITGDHLVWFLDGHTRVGASLFSPPKPASGNWTLVGTNDFNGDAKPDLLWRNNASGNFSIWAMNGVTRTSGVAFAAMSDLSNRVVGTGDFNLDGKPDIVWHHALTGALSVWKMNGFGVIEMSPLWPAALSVTSEVAAVGDVNGDRKADLLIRNLSTGALEAWIFDGTTRVGVSPITATSAPDLGWKVVAFEDLDRNGSNDIVWQNVSSNRLVVWSMDGTGVARASGSFLEPDGSVEPDLKASGPR